MIVESVKKEAIHMSPEELAAFSEHINRYIEAEEKVLNRVEASTNWHEPSVPLSLCLHFWFPI